MMMMEFPANWQKHLQKSPRVALAPERQEQLLAWVRETKDSTQWPDIKKQITKWLDTPVDKRPRLKILTT
jgi:exodeoxyribonuclease VIII